MPGLVQFGDVIHNFKDARGFKFTPKGNGKAEAEVLYHYDNPSECLVIRGEDAERLWIWLEELCGTRRLQLKKGVETITSPSRPLVADVDAHGVNPDPTGQPTPPPFARPPAAAGEPSRPSLFSDGDAARIIAAIREFENRLTSPDPEWIAAQTAKVVVEALGGPGARFKSCD